MLSPLAAAYFLALTLPFCIVACAKDLMTMRIPNGVSLGIAIVFVLGGAVLIPSNEYFFRLLVMVGVFITVYILNALGVMGGGDAKLIAAMSPFVAQSNWFEIVFLLSALALILLALHYLSRFIPAIQRRVGHWKSYETARNFPYGLPLGAGFVLFLGATALGVF